MDFCFSFVVYWLLIDFLPENFFSATIICNSLSYNVGLMYELLS